MQGLPFGSLDVGPQDPFTSSRQVSFSTGPTISVGFSWRCENGKMPAILAVDPGSPAQKAGLLVGDQIISVSSTNMRWNRVAVIGFHGEHLTGLVKQTFEAAAVAGGKMILEVERLAPPNLNQQRGEGGKMQLTVEVAPYAGAGDTHSEAPSCDGDYALPVTGQIF
jgi:hypothetical protein